MDRWEWLMEAVEGDGAAHGYVKLTRWLREEYKLVINKKKVYRMCKELDISTRKVDSQRCVERL